MEQNRTDLDKAQMAEELLTGKLPVTPLRPPQNENMNEIKLNEHLTDGWTCGRLGNKTRGNPMNDIYGRRICNPDCVAWRGEYCDANMDYLGVNRAVLCKIPEKYKLVDNNEL